MRIARKLTAGLTGLGVLLCLIPAPVLASGTAARLDGVVIGVDGRPATGATVYLLDERGTVPAHGQTSSAGEFSIADVPSGSYAVGVRTAEGDLAPVAGPPVRLAAGETARRDIKLVRAGPALIDRTARANYGFVDWFGQLSTGAQAGVVIGFIAAGFGLFELIDDEDDASPQ